MRILLLSHYGLPHTGGIEVVVDALARRFVRAGHEVTHLCSAALRPDDPSDVESLPYRRVQVRALNLLERFLGVPYPIFGPGLLLRLLKEVSGADVVHAHGVLYQNSLIGMIIAARRGKGTVVTEHVGTVPYRNRILRFFQTAAFATVGRVTLRCARRVLVLNDRVADEMRLLSSVARIEKLWNGVDVERFRPAATVDERSALRQRLGWDERRRLLLVGRIVEKKGVDVAVAAARALGSDYELLLVGPGSVNISLPANVTALGSKPPDFVADLYRAADALLLPSRGEGFPLAVQEALSSGLPVFVPGDPEFSRVLNGLEEAVQYISGDARQIAEAIQSFFGKVRDRRLISDKAASFARSRFGWDGVVRRHLDLYREILAEL